MGALGVGLIASLSRTLRADNCATGVRTPIEGPYYLGDPEERNDTGGDLTLSGTVFDQATCNPIPGAVIVRWHANERGFYEEFYRAKMVTGDDGGFSMSTIAPGQYAGLARHIHWFVVAEGYNPVIAQTQWQDSETIGGAESWNFSLVKV